MLLKILTELAKSKNFLQSLAFQILIQQVSKAKRRGCTFWQKSWTLRW